MAGATKIVPSFSGKGGKNAPKSETALDRITPQSQPSPSGVSGDGMRSKALFIGGTWRENELRGSDAPDQGKPAGGVMQPYKDWADEGA